MENSKSYSRQIMKLARERLLIQYRFLAAAMEAVSYQEAEGEFLMMIWGRTFFYGKNTVLSCFRNEPASISRVLLHALLHCLFGHPYQKQPVDRALWNLASDIAVEGAVLELPQLAVMQEDEVRRQHYLRLIDYAGGSSAEALYNYFADKGLLEEEQTMLTALFFRDDHVQWNAAKRQKQMGKGHSSPDDGLDDGVDESGSSAKSMEKDETSVGQSGSEDYKKVQDQSEQSENLQEEWRKIALKTKLEMELAQFGTVAGTLHAGLERLNRDKVDYRDFLKNFAERSEKIAVSQEEFDVIYYTYGLKRYGNIPLIEPLEYRDDRMIRNFAIAIDTSGSVQGELVESFLRHTFSILQETDSFHRALQLYILQCDSKLQSCVKISSLDEVEDLMRKFKLKGFGGTDFRPVFEYIDHMLERSEIDKLDGLLYFSDGVGIYPEKRPTYPTAFVFCREDRVAQQIPDWAIQAVIDQEQIRTVQEWI